MPVTAAAASPVLCLICREAQPQPVVCTRCEDHARRALDNIGAMCRDLARWQVIDPGTCCTNPDHRHTAKLALVDSPIITRRGTPNLAAIAASDPRSKVVHDPDDPDAVIPAAHWLIAEARWTANARRLAQPLADVYDAVRILNLSFDWSIRSPRANDYSRVLDLVALGLRRALQDRGEKTVGTCNAKRDQRDACGGPLRLDYSGPLPLDPDNQISPTHIQCAWCKDRWPIDPASLIAMMRVAAPKTFPIRVSYAAAQLGIPERTIQHWAAVGKIRRHGHGEVDLVDILAIATPAGKASTPSTDSSPQTGPTP